MADGRWGAIAGRWWPTALTAAPLTVCTLLPLALSLPLSPSLSLSLSLSLSGKQPPLVPLLTPIASVTSVTHRLTGEVVLPRHLGGCEPLVVRPSAGRVYQPTGHAVDLEGVGGRQLTAMRGGGQSSPRQPTTAPPQTKAHQQRVGHVKVEHRVNLLPALLQHLVQLLRLREGAGEAVQDEAPGAFGPWGGGWG